MTAGVSDRTSERSVSASIRLRTALRLLVIVLLTGCDANRGERNAVAGTVTFDEEPVVEGTITFVPIGETKGPLVGGNIKDGRYEIPAGDGPAAGSYRVEISALRETGKKAPDISGKLTLDEKESYLPKGVYSGSTSTLQAEIVKGANAHDFEMKSK